MARSRQLVGLPVLSDPEVPLYRGDVEADLRIVSCNRLAETITDGLSHPSKMPCPAWGLPASECRTGSKLPKVEGATCHECYALKGTFQFKGRSRSTGGTMRRIFHLLWTPSMIFMARWYAGIVGVSSQPVSGMTLVTLLGVASVFGAAGWTDPGARAAVLTVGTIVAVAASKAGDISQDLKTGYLVGATPAWQQFGQMIGASIACWAVAGAVMLLGNVYTFGSKEVPAPRQRL